MSRWMAMRGLLVKETWQILRDPSALLIAFLLPVVLLIIDGYGISLDARRMRLAVVVTAQAGAPEKVTAAGIVPASGPSS